MDKKYLDILKESVNPIINEQKLNEILDYIEYMEEVEDIFLAEATPAEIRSQIDTMAKAIKALQAQKNAARLAGNTEEYNKLLYKVSDLSSKQQQLWTQLRDTLKGAAAGAGKTTSQASDYVNKAGAAVSQGIEKTKRVASAAGQKAGEYAGKVKDFAGTTGGKYAMAGAAAAGAAVAAYAVYKRFFSQAAKACKGKSGAEKTSCMKAYKVKGLQAAMAKCGSDAKCKAKFQGKIAKLRG